MSQTQRVRMNLRPGSLPRSSVLHSRSSGLSDSWPAIEFFTTPSLKGSITAAMANAPPSRSYRLDSVISCLLDGFLEASNRGSSVAHSIGGRTSHTARYYAEPPPLGFQHWAPYGRL